MTIKELIEQIGGRDRLVDIKSRIEMYGHGAGYTADEVELMALALLAVLDAKPIAYMHHSGQVVTREECCDDRVFSICCKVETPLYTIPTAASVPDVNFAPAKSGAEATIVTHFLAPEGYKLVPIEPSKEMLLASKRYKAKNKVPTGPGVYRAMIAAAPVPGGDTE